MESLYISMCDNVLDPEDWQCHRLTLVNNVVTHQELVKFGVHPIPNMTGLTKRELLYQVQCLDESDKGKSPYCYPVLSTEPMDGSHIYEPWQINWTGSSPVHGLSFVTAILRNGTNIFSMSEFLNWSDLHRDDVVRFYQLRGVQGDVE